MIAQCEVESKWLISSKGFDALKSSCLTLRRIDQLNIYFDQSWILARAGATCRLRLAHQEFGLFTLKLPGVWDPDGTRRAIELEMPAHSVFVGGFSLYRSEIDRVRLAPEIRDALQRLNVSRLARVGRMRNTRHVLELPSGGVFELDQFSLPGGEVCFEVEVEEANDEARAAIVAAIRQFDPTARPSSFSKFQRFTEAAQRRKSRRAVPTSAGSPTTVDIGLLHASAS